MKPIKRYVAEHDCEPCGKTTKHIVAEYKQETEPSSVVVVCKCLKCHAIFHQKKLVASARH